MMIGRITNANNKLLLFLSLLLTTELVYCRNNNNETRKYEVGCLYPPRMLEPFAARNKLLGFTGVYAFENQERGRPNPETPIAIHQGQAFSYCDVNCLSYLDSTALNAIDQQQQQNQNNNNQSSSTTKSKPKIILSPQAQTAHFNSWSRMLCIAQCYAIFFVQEGNAPAIDTIIDTWRLPIQSTIENQIKDNFNDDNIDALQSYMEEMDYNPLVLGRLVAHEIMLFMENDGWNANGNLRYDATLGRATNCTANCMPYADTTGYVPRNQPRNIMPTINNISQFNVTGQDVFWQPLLEDDGRGYFVRQQHVAPHIGFHARYRLRNPATQLLDPPNYDYNKESFDVIQRLLDSAQNEEKWDQISFYDKKFLVRLLIQFEMRAQLGVLVDQNFTFEDELLFSHAMSAIEHDAVQHAWRAKVEFDLVRPTTVIQSWGSSMEITTFNGRRQNPGVATIAAADFQAFARVMPHSEFPSGSACICTAYQEMTDLFTKHFFQNYSLRNMYWGSGGVDLGCNENSRADFLGCSQGGFAIPNMTALAYQCGQSRLWGGMHFGASVPAGHELCSGLGQLGLDYILGIRNGGDLGKTHNLRDGIRPTCSDKSILGQDDNNSTETLTNDDENNASGGTSSGQQGQFSTLVQTVIMWQILALMMIVYRE